MELPVRILSSVAWRSANGDMTIAKPSIDAAEVGEDFLIIPPLTAMDDVGTAHPSLQPGHGRKIAVRAPPVPEMAIPARTRSAAPARPTASAAAGPSATSASAHDHGPW